MNKEREKEIEQLLRLHAGKSHNLNIDDLRNALEKLAYWEGATTREARMLSSRVIYPEGQM